MIMGTIMAMIGLAFCLFGSVVVLIALTKILRNIKSHSWPCVDGTVVSVTIQEHKHCTKGGAYDYSTFSVCRTCEYQVGGKKFHTDQATAQSGNSCATKEDAELESAKTPVGARTQVYYDPANPEESTLAPSFSFKPIFGALFGLAFIVMGVAVLVAAVEQFRL
jgi:hypothetical protein